MGFEHFKAETRTAPGRGSPDLLCEEENRARVSALPTLNLMRKTMLLLLFLFLFPAAPGAQAAIPDLDGTSAFRSLSATVDKISKDPKRYEKGSGREWAVKNLGSGLERVKKLIWERRGYRIAADLKSEGWSRAFLESRSRDDYQTDLDGLGPARRLVEEAASELVALRARVCRASWRRVKPGKSKKSRARAKRINRKRKAAALARQKRCRNEKQAAVQSKEERLTNLNNGIEAFRQAYINAYLDSTAAAEKEMRALEARNRASSNTLTRNELVRAVSLTNRARAAIGMPALPLPAPEMTPADTARSEFYGMMDPGNLNYRRAAASGVGVVRQGIWFEKKRTASRNGVSLTNASGTRPETESGKSPWFVHRLTHRSRLNQLLFVTVERVRSGGASPNCLSTRSGSGRCAMNPTSV